MQTERNHCSEHPNGTYTVTYTICESDTTTGVNAHQLYYSYGNRNVVGQIIAANDTLGTPAAPLASGTTVAAV
jgi:hypothetical protein